MIFEPTILQVEELGQRSALTGVAAGVMSDTGAAYRLEGAGTFGSLGVVMVMGNLHGVGFQDGHASGSLTLANIRGSVTIAVFGPSVGAESLPEQFAYRIISATGAYRNLEDEGTLHLRLTGSSAVPDSPSLGVFTMSLGA